MVKWFTSKPGDLVKNPDTVAVIGLGRFGQALALELMDNGTDVLGIDPDEGIVQSLNGRLTHVVAADATREEVLRQLSVPEMECAVVAIGNSVEASVLCTSLLLEFQIPQIWAKATSEAHGAILRRLGVEHVVYPEHQMGKRVAHLVRGALTDYIEIGDGYALVRTTPPRAIVGISIAEAHVRSRYGVTVITYKRGADRWHEVTASTVLQASDEILVTGPTKKAETFHQLE